MSSATLQRPSDGPARREDAAARGGRPLAMSIFGWAALVNVVVLAIVALLLIVTPIRISPDIALVEAGLVVGGCMAMLLVSLVLLRGVLAPLRRLGAAMREVDPAQPGRRLGEGGAHHAEVVAVTRAFDGMLDRLEEERRLSSRRVLEAQEAERLRIARELHDDIGQTLTAAAMDAERAADGGTDDRSQALLRAARSVRASLDDVRRIARELRPEALDDLGLANAIISLCRRVDASSGVHVRARIPGTLPAMTGEADVVIYRVTQESLTNVIRHAQGRRADVSLVPADDHVELTVRDDGKGVADGDAQTATGIAGMRERALLVGGELVIRRHPEGGTEVRLRVPLGEPGCPRR